MNTVDLTSVDFVSTDSYTDLVSNMYKGANFVNIEGSLAANNILTINYSVSNLSSSLRSVSLEAYADAGTKSVDVNLSTGLGVYNDDDDQGNLAIAALWDPATLSGSLTIENLSGVKASITSWLTAVLKGAGTFTLSASVSSVPLPAALPLFGLGLAALAGYRAKNKKAA